MGEGWVTAPSVADVAAANYRAKELERKIARLQEQLEAQKAYSIEILHRKDEQFERAEAAISRAEAAERKVEALTEERDDAIRRLSEAWTEREGEITITQTRYRKYVEAEAERDKLRAALEKAEQEYLRAWNERDAQRRRAEAAEARAARLEAALRKEKAFHDRDFGCNGFTAEYEILRAEIDAALDAKDAG